MAKIKNFSELQQAINNDDNELFIQCSILCFHSIILPENATLKGEKQQMPMLSFSNGDGIGLSAGNSISNLSIQTATNQKAIYTTVAKEDLGNFIFENLVITGQFSFIARAGVMRASIKMNQIDIVAADAKNSIEQPQKYGVNALQGALTIYNFNNNSQSNINLSAENISIGRKNAPVTGSGIFIAGAGDKGGWITISKLHTGAVYSNGKIPFGVADIITAGVFIVNGAKAKEIIHDGEIVTYGVNDMVLDTWGEVESWICNAPIISYGPSGVGFVNFGVVKKFVANAPIETYGLGARGYNQYDGTVDSITFKSISTYGDGSVAIQISKVIGKLTVNGDVTTHGSVGNSLVKGVNVELPAVALSIKPGGEVQEIDIKGNIVTNGADVITYEVNTGIVKKITIGGKIITNGKNSKPISIENNGQTPTDNLIIKN